MRFRAPFQLIRHNAGCRFRQKSAFFRSLLDAATGQQRWEFPLHSAPWAGVLATAGRLVFSGSDEGNFFALDAGTGKPLWDFQTGGAIVANPISFAIGGHQCVAVAANRVLYVFELPQSAPPAHLR